MRAISKVFGLGIAASYALAAVPASAAAMPAAHQATRSAVATQMSNSGPAAVAASQGNRALPFPPPVPGVGSVPLATAPALALPPPNGMTHGPGPVLKDFTRAALIFWGSAWPGDTRSDLITTMFRGVGASPWADTLLQYWDNQSSTDNTANVFAGSWVDTGSDPPGTYTQADVLGEVIRAINVGALGYDANTVYLVFPHYPAHIGDDPNACGYHSWNGSPWGNVVFGTIDENPPYPAGACTGWTVSGVSGAPNDPVTQGMTKGALHEFAEAVTDPFFDGWGPTTAEVGDLCSNTQVAVSLGGTNYVGQPIFGNREGACLTSTSVTFAYRWISQTYTPNPMTPRGLYSVQVVVQNTGNVQWPVDSVLRFATDVAQNRCSSYYDSGTWLDCQRVGGLTNQINPTYSTIQPGQNGVFTFNFWANPGDTCLSNNEHFNLLVEARAWLASSGIYWPVTEGCYNGTFQSETPPSPGLLPGDAPATNTTRIRFVNTGNVPWTNDGNFRLAYVGPGCSPFYDQATWINCQRASSTVVNDTVTNKTEVDPGEVGEFDVVLNVPVGTTPGTYPNQWQLVDEWAQWLSSSNHTSTYTVLA